MASINLRVGSAGPLTNQNVDDNFKNLNNALGAAGSTTIPTPSGTGVPLLSISPTTTGTFTAANITFSGTLSGSGTSLVFGTGTLALAGNVTHAGAFARTFTATAATTLTLPTSGTLVSTTAGTAPLATSVANQTTNGVLYQSGSGVTTSTLASTAAGQILTTVTLGSAPTWVTPAPPTTVSGGTTGLTPNTASSGTVTLAGTLVVGNGGTGVATLSGVAFGNGTSAFTAATSAQLVTAMGVANTTKNGYLSITDWNTFNGKQAALGFTPYNSTNPTGYITSADSISGNAATATTATNLSGGYVTATTITASGNITAYYSDDRLKTNLGNIPNALEKVMTLNGFYYEANETAQALGYEPIREIGVSAQQIQAILPEIVSPAPIDAQYLTVHYDRIAPLLIEAIKDQQNLIESLTQRLTALENK